MADTAVLTEVAFDGEKLVDVDALLQQLEHDPEAIPDGELAVRAMLLQVRRDRVEAERIRRLRDAVLTPYELALERLSRQEARIREALGAYLKRCNGGKKMSIPDAGTAFLATRNVGGRLVIRDVEAFEEALCELVEDEDVRRSLYREQLDRGRALELLLSRFYALVDGKLVRRDTGEFEELLPGLELEPETRELALRIV
jgi:hypothetical protein